MTQGFNNISSTLFMYLTNIKHFAHTWKNHAYVHSNDEIEDRVNDHEPAEPTK